MIFINRFSEKKNILPTGKLAQNVTVKYKTINKIYESN